MVDCRRFIPRVDGMRIGNPSNIENLVTPLEQMGATPVVGN